MTSDLDLGDGLPVRARSVCAYARAIPRLSSGSRGRIRYPFSSSEDEKPLQNRTYVAIALLRIIVREPKGKLKFTIGALKLLRGRSSTDRTRKSRNVQSRSVTAVAS